MSALYLKNQQMIDETFRGKLLNADKSCQGFDLEMRYVIKNVSNAHCDETIIAGQIFMQFELIQDKFRDHTLETL